MEWERKKERKKERNPNLKRVSYCKKKSQKTGGRSSDIQMGWERKKVKKKERKYMRERGGV